MASNYNVDLAMFHRTAEAEFPNCLGVGGTHLSTVQLTEGFSNGEMKYRGVGAIGSPPRKYPFICMSFAASLKCERVDSGLIDGMLQNAELGGGGSS